MVPVLMTGQGAETALKLLEALCRDRDFHSTKRETKEETQE